MTSSLFETADPRLRTLESNDATDKNNRLFEAQTSQLPLSYADFKILSRAILLKKSGRG
jgi:hypothetical protein